MYDLWVAISFSWASLTLLRCASCDARIENICCRYVVSVSEACEMSDRKWVLLVFEVAKRGIEAVLPLCEVGKDPGILRDVGVASRKIDSERRLVMVLSKPLSWSTRGGPRSDSVSARGRHSLVTLLRVERGGGANVGFS